MRLLAMARSKMPEWLEPEKLLLIRRYRRRGLTVEETAKKMGVGYSTLMKWSHNNLDIREALKTGKEEAIAVIENKLFTKALSGNLTAIIFYLKNNDRDNYNDSQLSPEELKQVAARTRKMLADARISEAKADLLERVSDTSNERLDEILDKLTEEVNEDDGTKKSNDAETDSGAE